MELIDVFLSQLNYDIKFKIKNNKYYIKSIKSKDDDLDNNLEEIINTEDLYKKSFDSQLDVIRYISNFNFNKLHMPIYNFDIDEKIKPLYESLMLSLNGHLSNINANHEYILASQLRPDFANKRVNINNILYKIISHPKDGIYMDEHLEVMFEVNFVFNEKLVRFMNMN